MPEEIVHFPRLDRGWSRIMPRGSMMPQGDGPLYRVLWNMLPMNGQLRPRPTLADEPSGRDGSPLVANSAATWPISEAHDEVHVIHANRIGVNVVWATQFDLYWNTTNLSEFFEYTTGTISWTSGTSTITGSGTGWDTAAMAYPNARILADGKYWPIDTVGGATSITVGGGTFSSTASGQAYAIRPTLLDEGNNYPFDVAQRIFTTVFNGDLYVAASYGKYGTGAAASKKDAIIFRVNDVESGLAIVSGDLEVLYGGMVDYAPGTGAQSAGYVIIPKGIDVLQDGRVVVPAHYYTATTAGFSRVFYSSHLDATEWNSVPGGFTDVVGSGTGPLKAMGRLDHDLTLHYRDGVVRGVQTGNSYLPLSFRRTRAKSGALSSRGIASLGQAELYVGSDGALHVFDGSSSSEINKDLRQTMSSIYESDLERSWVFYDDHLDHLWLFVDAVPVVSPTVGEGSDPPTITRPGTSRSTFPNANTQTMAFVVDLNSQQISRHVFPIGVYCAEEDFSTARQEVLFVVGVQLLGSGSHGLVDARTTGGNDETNVIVGTEYPQMFETDDIDLGAPGVSRSVTQVTFTYGDSKAAASSHNVGFAVSYDGGNTWDNASAALSSAGGSASTDDESHSFVVFDAAKSGDKARVRFRTESGVTPGSPDTWPGPMKLDYYLTKMAWHVSMLHPKEAR